MKLSIDLPDEFDNKCMSQKYAFLIPQEMCPLKLDGRLQVISRNVYALLYIFLSEINPLRLGIIGFCVQSDL